jgi:leader peptidase (prepilin peptidase)/N-methyltransferase
MPLEIAETAQPSIVTAAAIVIWFAVLGSVWGSFFNVVVYRMPRAISIIRPGSHCPACRHPIRLYDNIPVLSWFLLRGRCRDCQARISPRYPIVEAVSAIVFAVLAYLEIWAGGTNLPRPDMSAMAGSVPVSWSDLQLLGICAFHLTLVGGLFCAALIELDGYAVPWRLAAVVLGPGLAAPVIWPFLHPVAALGTVPSGLDPWTFAAGTIDTLAGLSVGVVLATVALLGLKADDEFDARGGLFFGFMALGVFLGWQAAALVGACAAVLRLTASSLAARIGRVDDSRHRTPAAWTPWLAAAAMAWIVFWRPLDSAVAFAAGPTALLMLVFAAAAVALASFLTPVMSDDRHREES